MTHVNRKKFAVEPLTASPAGGKLAAVVGAPSLGDVPTWDGSQYVPSAGGGASSSYIWAPLTTTNAAGDPELVWDADDQLVMTFVPLT